MYRASEATPFACDAGLTVGTLVALDTTADNKVVPCQTATIATQPCIGVCVERLSSTCCLVQLSGLTPQCFSGLSRGTVYYAGDAGALALSGDQAVLVATCGTQGVLTTG